MNVQRLRALVRLVLLFYFSVVANGASSTLSEATNDVSKSVDTSRTTTTCHDDICDCDFGLQCTLGAESDIVLFNVYPSAAATLECVSDQMMNARLVIEQKPKANIHANSIFLMKNCTRFKALLKRPNVMYYINITEDSILTEDFFQPWHGIHSTIIIQMSSERVVPAKLFHNLKNLRTLAFFTTPAATPTRKAYILPSHIFETLVDLETLAFDFTQTANARVTLQNLTTAHFRNLTALKHLKLVETRVGALPADIFSTHTQLEYLNLRANNLQVLPSKLLDAQRKLLILDLSENALEHLPAELLKHTTALYHLSLRDNRLHSVTNIIENIRALPYLHKLDLCTNSLESVRGTGAYANETLMSGFKHKAKLTARMLEKISTILGDYVEQEENTKTHLDVSRNRIGAFDMSWFDGAPFYLNISDNNISNIYALKPLLQNDGNCRGGIDIVGNPLVCDCKLAWAYNNSCIANLDSVLCNNTVPTNSYGRLNYMHENDLCAWPHAMCPHNCVCTARATSLQITCAGANMSTLPHLPRPEQVALHATELDISRNRFRTLPTHNTFGYANVTHLNVSHNEISELDVAQLPPHLVLLDVRHNNLTHLSYDFLNAYILRSEAPLQLYLAHNPWQCDCKGAQLVRAFYIYQRRILDGAQLFCANRKKVRIIEVDWRDLCESQRDGLAED